MTDTDLRSYPTRARAETIFEAACPEDDPEGIISRYVEYAFYRSRMDEVYSLRGGLGERLNILYWYLGGYAAAREGQIPLSKRQLEFFNGPVPIIGMHPAVTIAAYTFCSKELAACDLTNPEARREALFWWSIQRAPTIARGGELVTSAQVSLLRESTREPPKFPLNYFARRTHQLDGRLSSHLNLDQPAHRAILLCVLLLRCAGRPELARYLPRGSVAELIHDASQRNLNLFESVLELALGGSEAHSLSTQLQQLLDQAGFPITRNISYHPPGNVGLCLQDDPNIGPGLADGIAVIGPTNATSGLGQATRLSIDVLQRAGFHVATIDFNMDNPAPLGFASTAKGSALRQAHKINLVHLNAESIPLAFAYLSERVYENSYNIGYFFWELNRLPKCHLLALEMLDEIWVSSEYNREIYARQSPVPVVNVGMAVEALPEPSTLSFGRFGLQEGSFAFLATFDSFSFIERKNPLGVIRAFEAAFPRKDADNVKLVIKTQNRSRVEDAHQVRIWQEIDKAMDHDGRIHVIDETLTYPELLALKRLCNCYISLHRSEGWGFGMIEAMQLGIPVIATAYSGNMEFCTPETCFLVDYEMTGPRPDEYIFVERGSQWAEPDTRSAAKQMRRVCYDKEAASTRAIAASDFIGGHFSVPPIAARYKARLSEIDQILAVTSPSAVPGCSHA